MKNSLEKATFKILLYKRRNKYVAICYETGWVESYNSPEEALKHVTSGLSALMKTIRDGNLDIAAINQAPPLKNRIVFYSLPIIGSFLKSIDQSLISKSISPVGLA